MKSKTARIPIGYCATALSYAHATMVLVLSNSCDRGKNEREIISTTHLPHEKQALQYHVKCSKLIHQLQRYRFEREPNGYSSKCIILHCKFLRRNRKLLYVCLWPRAVFTFYPRSALTLSSFFFVLGRASPHVLAVFSFNITRFIPCTKYNQRLILR